MTAIAVVDDEANIRETVAFALKREGYRVNTYADGAEAWAAFLFGDASIAMDGTVRAAN